ncbi:hypothetical protein AAZX31_15G079100 [Glycine max]|uniref:Uncharacterized protein n=3 Tax=Glycine subgen. Soja TaxID=1462606 RepID=I1MER7_SOYBN|nr:macrodontain-1 [Glycine max]XP_028203488.1 macrodontain-1-like [Glycine soja]KAG4948536.1 hypothetical protein JHK86_041775 [Glycine max]KAG4956009.1 hypothetical protein JHK85_042389 [Glycine max]KAG5104747.1 hypothetical protein JHK82_041717 [Glycine max]KAG5115876.1 hypothetical protein JHK84_041989 [Glycine max]KAH1146200.1 hypothetical protein GYH30_041726 [Glycine max]|eukprot:XP_003547166.1 macrodontain-1 [Glycine max]
MMIPHTSNLFLLFFFMTCTTLICLSSSSCGIPDQYNSILGPNLDKLPSQEEAMQLFQLWKKEHGRVYRDLEEMAKKFEIFVSNVKNIIESNAKRSSPSSYLLGLNQFADWSPYELQETYLHNIPMPENISAMDLNDSPCSAPPSVDWRPIAVTAVKNQKDCGSCWAFSATGAIEGASALATGKLISVSEQELLDCAYSFGCGGGWIDKALDWVIGNRGIASEIDYPYTARKGTCRASTIRNSVSIDGYCPIAQSDNAFMCATAKYPIGFYFNVVNDFFQYKSGIYDGPNCPVSSTFINHAMLIVGYGSIDGVGFWIVKNSWDTTWGMCGYALIKRDTSKPYGVCGIHAWPAYAATKCIGSVNPSIISSI